MPRPKGSKNKTAKTAKTKATKKKASDFQPPFTDDDEPLTELSDEAKHAVRSGGEIPEGETPKGSVKKSSNEGDCQGCGHGADKHYGNPERWCNMQKCRCAAYQA